MSDLYLFFTMCYVRVLASSFIAKDHLLPFYLMQVSSVKSYVAVHSECIFEGSRWFIHRSLHCLGFLKNYFPERMKRSLAMEFHLFLLFF